MRLLVSSVCLVGALLSTTFAASLPERDRRSVIDGWNDPTHPFPLSSWSDWTPCTASCNLGYQGRHNCGYGYTMPDLSNPHTAPGPTEPNCAHSVATCNLKACDDKYDWQLFETCDQTCGGGERRRLTGPACLPSACLGGLTYSQTINCHTQSCDIVQGCGKADIMYVLDSSGSVTDYNWFAEKQFAIDVIKALDIGSDDTRVGVVSYSTEVQVNFDFEEHSTVDDLEEAIWGIPWMAGSTNTADGIRLARTVVEQQGRSDVKKIMVVISDGKSNILNETTIPQAEEAKAEGILVFVIGIGDSVNNDELIGIGSTPSDKYVYHVSDFDSLSTITQTIVEGTCEPVVECGAFSVWSECSVSCGGGVQTKSRTCTESVDGVVQRTWEDVESNGCSEEECPVETTECTDWENEGTCSASCGGGSQTRTRVCTTYLGQTVIDTDEQTRLVFCNTHLCPVTTCNGWEQSTECSVSCGEGTATYKRDCRTVYGDGAADDITEQTETNSCNDGACPVKRTECTDWQDDGTCSASCAGGDQTRARVCTTYLDQTVIDTDRQTITERCNTHLCPVTTCNGWEQSTECSVSCGEGTATYQKDCRTVYFDGTADAFTEQTRTDSCNDGACPVATGPDCGKCSYSNGKTDYLPVPANPCHFYMCNRKGDGPPYTYTYTEMPCGAGTRWDQDVLTCGHDTEGVCNGAVVPPTPAPGAGTCHLVPVDGDDTVYWNSVANVQQPCGAGTVFSQHACGCVLGDNPAPICDEHAPLLYFPFDDDFKSVGCEKVLAEQAGATDVTRAWEHKRGTRSAGFDGTGVLVVPFMANFFANRNVQAFTVALWFKWTGDTSKIGGLVNNGNCETDPSFDVHVGIGEDVSGTFSTDAVFGESTGDYPVGRWGWNHVAEVYDGTTLKLYVNGVVRRSVDMTGPIANTHCSMIIGQLGQDEGAGLFTGFIDELRVYLRALDAAEIGTL